MTIGIMQPYFMPYIGYWQLIAAVDTYVVYDDVNFIKRGWINRNNILLKGEKKLFSIALHEASQNKLINEISIADDFSKLRKTIQMAYAKAPFYAEIMELLDSIFDYPKHNIALFIDNSIRKVCDYLNIQTNIILSSNIEKDNALKGQEKIISICKLLQADTYINAIGGVELYDKKVFERNNICLLFLKPEIECYQQFKNDFVPGLSMIDVLMFCSPKQIREMLQRYSLIESPLTKDMASWMLTE